MNEPRITLIAAMDRRGGIGKGNALPWRLKSDMAHFRAKTMGQTILMGRKTFASIGHALPGRLNLVLTNDRCWSAPNAFALHRIDDLARYEGEIYVIGGADLYRQMMGVADRLIITHVDALYDCDTFFPQIDPETWRWRSYMVKREPGEPFLKFAEYSRVHPGEYKGVKKPHVGMNNS